MALDIDVLVGSSADGKKTVDQRFSVPPVNFPERRTKIRTAAAIKLPRPPVTRAS